MQAAAPLAVAPTLISYGATPMNLVELLDLAEDRPGELRQRLFALERLLEVTRRLAAEIELEKVLQIVTVEACKALNCDRASLYQYDRKREELYTTVVTELEIEEIRHSLDRGIAGHVARHRTVENIPDPPLDPRWNSRFDRETGYQTRSILAAPLTSPGGELLGVLQLLNKEEGPFNRYDEILLEAFSQHAAVALDRARLVHELKKQHENEVSLNVARDIQRGFMPQVVPDTQGYEIANWWFPNQAVGGDYCDVLPLLDGRTGLVIADVSGHGLGPSLIMASVRAALRALLLEHSSPEVLLSLLVQAMADDFGGGHFITMVMAALDPQQHTVEFANAGHAPAEHFSAATGKFTMLDATGMPLGILDDAEYPQGPVVRMEVGDLLVLCTDGIVEAMDERGEQFGYERMRAIIRQHAKAPIADLVRQIGKEVEAHYTGDSPPDDLTVLAARRNV